MLAILDTAIVPDVWWVAIGSAETIAYAIGLMETIRASRACNFSNILNICIIILMLIPRLATMHTYLLVCILVIITRGTRTRYIGTINTVITWVTDTEVIVTIAPKGAIIDTVAETEQPHVILDYCRIGF